MTRKTKTDKVLLLAPYGRFLGYRNMSFVIRNDRNKKKEKKVPFYRVGEVILQSGNTVSTGALACAGFWGIDVLVMTASGKPVATMVSLDDCSHVGTRLAQYEAYNGDRKVEIAKAFVSGKIESQSLMLRKHGLDGFKRIPDLASYKTRNSLYGLEARYSQLYFNKIFSLFPDFLRIDRREGYRAYDATNNLLNFAYEFLKWKLFRALIKAKLEPYLGFLHGVQRNRPSLVCDFQELYRCLMDDFIIWFSDDLSREDFEKCYERTYYNKKSPRVYLDHRKTNILVGALHDYFKMNVNVGSVRRGKRQSLETLINEEAGLFASCLRDGECWRPRIVFPVSA